MEGQTETVRKKKWFPLQANPQVMNTYIANLGFPVQQFCFTDVFSWEDWAIGMLPQPVLGLVLLFPINELSEAAKNRRLETQTEISPNVYHMIQHIGNACGTIGLLHLLANVQFSDVLEREIPFEGFLESFFRQTREMDSENRGRTLEESEELSEIIERAHQDAAQKGQSRVPDINEKIRLHFMALVPKDGAIYQLDGRLPRPVNHGVYASKESFGAEAAQVIKREFMDVDPDNMQFNIVALVPNDF